MIETVKHRLGAKSAALLVSIEQRLDRIMLVWLVAAGLACAARLAISPHAASMDAGTLSPYILLTAAPLLSMLLALRWFRNADRMPQPEYRLSRIGQWIDLRPDQARRHRLFGPKGLMVSLLVGILLNIPLRAMEYLAAMPALAGDVPAWLGKLHLLMTMDVVLFTSLYAVAFVAALRKLPLFPRLLVAIWCVDLGMQLLIAGLVSQLPGLPADVAVALSVILEGNVQKVLISAAIWLPYLILSKRVNVTYRRRIAR